MECGSFFYPFAFDLYTDDNLADNLLSVPHDKKVLLWAHEAVQQAVIQRAIDLVHTFGMEHRVFWLFQPSHQIGNRWKTRLADRLFFIDLDLLLLELQINVCQTSQPNVQWNACSNRFLFPTGKPNRPNRIRLLYKFELANLLTRCDWSLFVDEPTWNQSRQLLPELTDEEFDHYVEAHNRNLDNLNIFQFNDHSNHSHGYPFDGNLYANTSFRVISETQAMDTAVVSEKTWITMANNVPFILIAYPNNLQYLKYRGYQTFENYLPIPHYDSIQDQESRLDAVVTNTKFWLEHIQQQQQHIRCDVQHNSNLLKQDVVDAISQAHQLLRALDEPDRSIFSMIPLSPEQQIWTLFYYNIKAPDWPDCYLEDNFKDLPFDIQHECQQEFGYIPPNRR